MHVRHIAQFAKSEYEEETTFKALALANLKLLKLWQKLFCRMSNKYRPVFT